MMPADDSNAPCPCGRAAAYAACCARWHAGAPAPDAEALMRSRYTAFVLGLVDYLFATWHPDRRPATLSLDAGTTWLGLDVRRHVADGDRAEVEFVARFRRGGGRAVRQHETSRFVCEDSRWFYVDGVVA